jgi:hypothetical protein
MTKTVKAITLMLVISCAVFAARAYNSADQAARNANMVSKYLNQGFVIDSVTPNQHRYIVAPTGNYVWGTATINMHGRTGGFMSLETTYVTITVDIEHQERGKGSKYIAKNDQLTNMQIVY